MILAVRIGLLASLAWYLLIVRSDFEVHQLIRSRGSVPTQHCEAEDPNKETAIRGREETKTKREQGKKQRSEGDQLDARRGNDILICGVDKTGIPSPLQPHERKSSRKTPFKQHDSHDAGYQRCSI